MRQLILFRHAKAEHGHDLQDFERALVDKGRADAQRMGLWLSQNGPTPDHVLVSPARRTRETWGLAAGVMGGRATVTLESSLYEAGATQIVSRIQAALPQAKTVAVVGHNPGLEELAVRLSRLGDGEARRRLGQGFPPGSIALISIKAESWEQFSLDDGELMHFVTPDTLGVTS